MSKISFKHLIELATGSPDSGTINSFALNCVLCSFAEKFNCVNQKVDCSKYGNVSKMKNRRVPLKKSFRLPDYEKSASKHELRRLSAGADAEDAAAESDAPPPQEEAHVEDPPEATGEPEPEHQVEEPLALSTEVTAPSSYASLAKTTSQSSPKKLSPQSSSHRGTLKSNEHSISTMSLTEEEQLDPDEPPKSGFMLKVYQGMSLMTRELDVAIGQLQAIASIIVIDHLGPQSSKMKNLRYYTKKLKAVKKYNAYLRTVFHDEESEVFADDISEENSLEVEAIGMEAEVEETKPLFCPSLDITCVPSEEHLSLQTHFVYPPERLIDQFIVIKSNFCQTVTKVNELNARLCEFDYENLLSRLDKLDKGMEAMERKHSLVLQDIHRLNRNHFMTSEIIGKLDIAVKALEKNKAELSWVTGELLLKAKVVDLNRRPTYDELALTQCSLEKEIGNILKGMQTHKDSLLKIAEDLRIEIGPAAVRATLVRFRIRMEAQIQEIADLLKKYVQMTNDECATAGGRVRVLNDLTCISCDTECVMNVRERCTVPKLPSVGLPPRQLGPVITYERGTLRKCGIEGYYRKAEKHISPKQYLKSQRAALVKCVPRHAGGPHTKHTVRDLFAKVLKRQ